MLRGLLQMVTHLLFKPGNSVVTHCYSFGFLKSMDFELRGHFRCNAPFVSCKKMERESDLQRGTTISS
jgi:hypothetical protein